MNNDIPLCGVVHCVVTMVYTNKLLSAHCRVEVTE